MKVIFVIAMMMSFVADAEWVFVAEGENQDTYIDPSTLKKTKDGYRRIWSLSSHYKPVVDPNSKRTYKSVKALEVFDCEDERRATLQETLFTSEMGAGEAFGMFSSNNLDWGFVAPGSIGETVLDFVCKRRK